MPLTFAPYKAFQFDWSNVNTNLGGTNSDSLRYGKVFTWNWNMQSLSYGYCSHIEAEVVYANRPGTNALTANRSAAGSGQLAGLTPCGTLCRDLSSPDDLLVFDFGAGHQSAEPTHAQR